MQLDLQPIIDRQKELERVIRELTARIAQAPPGHLVISKHKQSESVKYYQCVSGDGDEHRSSKKTYIRKTDLALIKALANKGYYLTVLSRVRAEYAVISRFLKTYPAEHGEDIYPKLSEDRKPLVDPYYVTERGERVRSKSELIIANWLFQHGIPYRYECALELWDPKQPRRITIYPDFTILDPATGKCFYLEHLGMMEDERYFRSAMDRISLYEANGYFVGESLLLSFESDKVPLDVRTLGRRVEHALGRDS